MTGMHHQAWKASDSSWLSHILTDPGPGVCVAGIIELVSIWQCRECPWEYWEYILELSLGHMGPFMGFLKDSVRNLSRIVFFLTELESGIYFTQFWVWSAG